MQFIASPKIILGLDVSDLSIKAVQIAKRGEKKYIRAINTIEVPAGCISEGEIKDIEKVAELVKQLIKGSPKKFSTKYVTLSLPETKTFIKVIEVPTTDIAISEAIRQELPRHIPIGNEEMQIDWQAFSDAPGKKKFLVGAVPKSVTDDYIKAANLAGLMVVALEIEAEAIARCILPAKMKKKTGYDFGKLFKKKSEQKKGEVKINDKKGPVMLVDFGATRTSLIFMDHGVIQFTNNLSRISGQKITEKIAGELQLTNEEAEKAKIICGTNPKRCKGATMRIINETINELAKEIASADNFYQTHFGQESGQLAVILCGGGSKMMGLDKTLQEKLGREIYYGNPLTNIESLSSKREDLLAYTTAIGLALRNFIVTDY
ncbi:MAG TPA: type IV pilus assembly protein PilM [Patescibacteria group bacterium]|nr:type IV pilus assembly protein PilM [Patescibacteria group bacterium]